MFCERERHYLNLIGKEESGEASCIWSGARRCGMGVSEDGIHNSPRLRVQQQDWPLLWGLFHAGSVTVTSVLSPECSFCPLQRNSVFLQNIPYPLGVTSSLTPKVFSTHLLQTTLHFCLKIPSSILDLPHSWGPARTSGVLPLVATERPAPVTEGQEMAQ